MAYQETPWSLSEDSITKTKKKVKKSTNLPKGVRFTEDEAVSAARIMDLFEKNKTKMYTNKDIAEELKLSEGTVTGVTTRLEALRKIKIVEILQRVSAYTVYYQHIEGPANRVNKRRGKNGDKKDTAQVMLELFESNKNRSYTKKELLEILTSWGESEGQIDVSLRILLLNWDVKVVGENDGILKYQHVKGNQRGLKVYGQPDKRYARLSDYLVKNKASYKKEFFLKSLQNKTPRLFSSSKKIQKQYLITDLDKILKDSNSILRRIFGNL